jgi:hypothetical protein
MAAFQFYLSTGETEKWLWMGNNIHFVFGKKKGKKDILTLAAVVAAEGMYGLLASCLFLVAGMACFLLLKMAVYPLKHDRTSAGLHRSLSKKTDIFMVTAMRTSDVTKLYLLFHIQ